MAEKEKEEEWVPPVWVHPECAQGKHANCDDGMTLNDKDEWVTCACACHKPDRGE